MLIIGKIVKEYIQCSTKKQEGSRKRGTPQLRWEDCVKRDMRKAEEEEKWRENANTGTNGSKFRKLPYFGVTSRPHPYTTETRGRTTSRLGGIRWHAELLPPSGLYLVNYYYYY